MQLLLLLSLYRVPEVEACWSVNEGDRLIMPQGVAGPGDWESERSDEELYVDRSEEVE